MIYVKCTKLAKFLNYVSKFKFFRIGKRLNFYTTPNPKF